MQKLEMKYLPLTEIDISRSNVRKVNIEEDIDELAANIKEIGVQQPVVVFFEKGRYELIIGQRRYLASKKAGLKEIPALITSIKNTTEAMIRSFSENIHRLKLDYRDKMQVARNLLNHYGSINSVANVLGLSEATVRNYLGYAGVPEGLKQMVSDRFMSAATATEISKHIADEKEAMEIARRVIETPRGERRTAIIETAKEHPNKKAPEIYRLSQRQQFKKITLHLSSRVAEALATACRDYSSSPTEIAIDALEDWLTNQGFLK